MTELISEEVLALGIGRFHKLLEDTSHTSETGYEANYTRFSPTTMQLFAFVIFEFHESFLSHLQDLYSTCFVGCSHWCLVSFSHGVPTVENIKRSINGSQEVHSCLTSLELTTVL